MVIRATNNNDNSNNIKPPYNHTINIDKPKDHRIDKKKKKKLNFVSLRFCDKETYNLRYLREESKPTKEYDKEYESKPTKEYDKEYDQSKPNSQR